MAMVLRENIAGLPPGSEHIVLGSGFWVNHSQCASRQSLSLRTGALFNKGRFGAREHEALVVSQNYQGFFVL
jgi:hypothetical protein